MSAIDRIVLLAAVDLGSFALGLVSFLLSRWLYDNWITRKRLTTALLIECIGTVRRFCALIDKLKPANLSEGEVPELRHVCDLPSGIVFSEPIDDPKGLIVLLPTDEGREILSFYDRWSRISAISALYASLHDKLLTLLGRGDTTDTSPQLISEYWNQLAGLLDQMHVIGCELCYWSCKLVIRHGPRDPHELDKLSRSLWKSNHNCIADRDKFHTLSKRPRQSDTDESALS